MIRLKKIPGKTLQVYICDECGEIFSNTPTGIYAGRSHVIRHEKKKEK